MFGRTLVGEVLRVHGYDKIAAKPFAVPSSYRLRHAMTRKDAAAAVCRRCMQVAWARGLNQAVHWAFISEEDARRFSPKDIEPLAVAHPLSRESAFLRPSLLPSLLRAVERNIARGILRGGLFEHGTVWRGGTVEQENTHFAYVRWGLRFERHWRHRMVVRKRLIFLMQKRIFSISFPAVVYP